MKYYNINNREEKVSLRQAVFKSVPRANDLYMPENIPDLPVSFFDRPGRMDLKEIALEVTNAMFGDEIPRHALEHIVEETFKFDIPLKKLGDEIYVLELFHGPTLAFKDVGARFMAGLFEYLINDQAVDITILAATSGDTGSAVANAFFNRKRINVVILYPSGRVSGIQEKQLTTMGGNITALEIDGDFDDCQRLVKLAFADKTLNEHLNLTSANSINFARLFPQSIYYFHAISQLDSNTKPVVFSVPSGNFGNLTAGLIAKRMGLRAGHFIAATNSNHVFVDWLTTGLFLPRPTVHTISNAMDVGNPGNFPRINQLFGNEPESVSTEVSGYWFDDQLTRKAMLELHDTYNYLSDPHGAIAYAGLKKYMEQNLCTGIFLETAHPAKFPAETELVTNMKIEIPGSLRYLLDLKKVSVRMSNDYHIFRNYLLEDHA